MGVRSDSGKDDLCKTVIVSEGVREKSHEFPSLRVSVKDKREDQTIEFLMVMLLKKVLCLKAAITGAKSILMSEEASMPGQLVRSKSKLFGIDTFRSQPL